MFKGVKQHIDIARQNLNLIEKTITDVTIAGQADYTLRDRARFEVEKQMEKEGVTLEDLDSPTDLDSSMRQLMTIEGGKVKRADVASTDGIEQPEKCIRM
jgi:hypothetical protein